MHVFANERHEFYLSVWAVFDATEFAFGLVVGIFLIMYH